MASADDLTITLDNTTPYFDVIVRVDTETVYTISTFVGTRLEVVDSRVVERAAWVDSWLWLYRGVADSTTTNAIAADDDSNFSQGNEYASIIRGTLSADTYTIRATSFDYVASRRTPYGVMILSSNLIQIQDTNTALTETVTAVTDTPTIVAETPTAVVETSTVAPEPPAPAPAPEPAPTPRPIEIAPVAIEPEAPSVVEEAPQPLPIPEVAPEPEVIPEEAPPAPVVQEVVPPESVALAPNVEDLVPHIQEDIAGVENGGIKFFGTKEQPQVIGEDGKLTPSPPLPGSGDYLNPDAITTADTFIGQAGGVTFNSPDIAIPVEPIDLNIEIPGIGDAAQALANTYVALANVGSDMSPLTRKKAKKIIVTTMLGAVIIRRFP